MKKITFSTFLLAMLLIINQSFAQTERYSRIKLSATHEQLQQIAKKGISFDNIFALKDGSFTVELSQNELNTIEQMGITFKIEIADVSQFYSDRNKGVNIDEVNKLIHTQRDASDWTVPDNFNLGTCGGFLTYTAMLQELDDMAAAYPNLVTVKETVGTYTTTGGRPIYVVKISDNPNVNEDEAEVLYTGMHHAREAIGLQAIVFYMWYLLENYDTNPEIQSLVNSLQLYFMPCVNPDGYSYNIQTDPTGGGMWRKNRRNNGSGSFGVDLNRNYGYMWGYDNEGSSNYPDDDTYRGPSGFSEPETQAIKYFCETHQISNALNYHSYSNLLIYPYGYLDNFYSPDNNVFMAYSSVMTQENGFATGTAPQLLYAVNGSSDDWMYGEQTTKNKIFAMTPEVGDGNDGFWPEINRIVPLCQQTMWMNLCLSRFAMKYAKVQDLTPNIIGQTQGYFHYSLQVLGLDTIANFTVSITPLTGNIETVGEAKIYSNLGLLETKNDSIAYTFQSSISNGAVVKYLLSVNNGSSIVTDTITKVFGHVTTVFADNCDAMTNWTSTKWNTTNVNHSAPKSITDSPTGDYQSNVNAIITSNQALDLTDASMAVVSFWCKWETENGYDFVQFMVSTNNGTTWTALNGTYTSSSDIGPVYQGTQSTWVKEEIELSDYVGYNLKFRFVLTSDYGVNADGFYFDDFTVQAVAASAQPPVVNFTEALTYNEDESATFNLSSYISDNDNTINELSITFEGNIYSNIIRNAGIITLSSNIPNWNGTETVIVTVSDGTNTVTSNLTIVCNAVNDAPYIADFETVTYREDENASVDLANRFFDVDNGQNDLTFSVSEAENLLITPNNLGLSVASKLANWNGNDTFYIKLSDGQLVDSVAVAVICTAVNDAPIIVSQDTLRTSKNTALEVTFDDLTVEDVDNVYPTNFVMYLLEGENYTKTGTTITPASDYIGTLTVPVKITDGFDFSNQFNLTIEVTIPDAVENLINQNDISIYPNPAQQNITVTFGEKTPGSIELLNAQGQSVQKINKLSGKQQVISLINLPSGVYYLKVNGENSITKKIIVK